MQSRTPKPGEAIHYALARICEGSRKACLSLPPLFLRCVVDTMRCFLIKHSRPKSAFHAQRPPPNPASAGNLVMQGLVVNTLRTRNHEPLRSASYLSPWVCYHLGILTNGLWCVRSGSCCLQDPLGCSAAPGLLLG